MLHQCHVAGHDVGESIGRLLSSESVYTLPATLEVGAGELHSLIACGISSSFQSFSASLSIRFNLCEPLLCVAEMLKVGTTASRLPTSLSCRCAHALGGSIQRHQEWTRTVMIRGNTQPQYQHRNSDGPRANLPPPFGLRSFLMRSPAATQAAVPRPCIILGIATAPDSNSRASRKELSCA
jgi:hypothetical protein